jgi:sodium-dependent phosphate transporter
VIPFWTLALGAAGMATGILTYGYKTLTMLGVKVTRISPVRGVCMDMSTAIVIIVATYLQIPVSSTQVTVGSIIGVGLASGTLNQFGKKLHWGNLAVIFLGWLVTLIFSAGLSYILYSLIYRSPNFTAAALRPTIIQSRNLTIQNNFLQSLNVNLTNNLTNLSNNLTNAYAEINTLKALVANLTANPTVF